MAEPHNQPPAATTTPHPGTPREPAERPRRAKPGSWKPGQSGNPRGRPRKGHALAEAIREGARPEHLVEVALDLLESEQESTRLQALHWLSANGYQRPAERHEVVAGVLDDEDEDLSQLSLDELRALQALEERHEHERRALLARSAGAVPASGGQVLDGDRGDVANARLLHAPEIKHLSPLNADE